MMKAKMAVICAILITFLVVESCCTPKNKVTPRIWGPQSMLYLKGRYGRGSTEKSGSENPEINTWNLLPGDDKRTRALGIRDHWKRVNAKNINPINMK